MSLLALFNELNGDGWTTSGLDVQYKVVDGMLMFQCSNGQSDWIHNFNAVADVYKDSDIPFTGHEGFIELWQSIRHDIEKLNFHSIAGYSQGGALAVLAHENYYHRFGFEPDCTITFGCPPSIIDPTPELSIRFSNLVNWHNPRDLVYLIPQIIGFQHMGHSYSLRQPAKRPAGCPLLRWWSGHSQEEYRSRLKWSV